MIATVAEKSVQRPVIVSIEPPTDRGDQLFVEATIPGHDGWKARIGITRRRAYEVVSCEVLALDPDEVPIGGLKARTLRAVPIAGIIREAFRDRTKVWTVGWLLDQIQGPGTAKAVWTSVGPASTAFDDAFYAQVALDWERLTEEGSGARARFAFERSQHESTVKNWVHEATRRGFLDQAGTPGPRARRATAAARELLEGDK